MSFNVITIILFVNNNSTQVAKFTWGRLFALIGSNEEEVGILKICNIVDIGKPKISECVMILQKYWKKRAFIVDTLNFWTST